jgi:hypothetical protein
MKVAMMQPAFLPWQGYFELIYYSDCFIFLNDFQFSVQSHHQRNRLFTNHNQVDWYTVPVVKSSSFGANLDCVVINEAAPWRKKILNRLQHNYSRAAFFGDIFPIIEKCLGPRTINLADLNITFIRSVIELFGWKRELRLSSNFKTEATRSNRVLDLLRWCNATEYYSAHGAFRYMLEDSLFPMADLEILFQDFVPATYPQIGSPEKFIPSLSVLDALFNIGPTETARIITSGTQGWKKWYEMNSQINTQKNNEGENVGI